MFKKLTNFSVKLVSRYLPDAFVFAIVLTLIAFAAAMPLTNQGPIDMVRHWGNGVWSLLGFSMQMALVLVLGSALATAGPVKKLLVKLASLPKSPKSAIVYVTVVSMIAMWFNWGFGLIVGAIYAKEIAKKVDGVDYRLLVASAYTVMAMWHAGLSGSIPLQIANWTEALQVQSAGVITESIPVSETIFSAWNLIIIGVIAVVLPLVNMAMHPSKEDTVVIDKSLLVDEEIEYKKPETPAEKLENSKILNLIVVALFATFLFVHFRAKGILNGLDINTVNLIFLALGLLLHGSPINYVRAVYDASKGAGGVLLQFPFYAGVMGLMTGANIDGVSLASVISNGIVSFANQTTFPLFSFLSAGIVNFFVPSGGGQWAVQAPIMMPAGEALGVAPSITAMSIAWGDAWTNLLQPFWALPALAIAKLGARDIMGYCLISLISTGIIICLGFLVLVGMMGMG